MTESILKLSIICATFIITVAIILISCRTRKHFCFLIKAKYKNWTMETRVNAENSIIRKDSKKKKSASRKSTSSKNIKIQ